MKNFMKQFLRAILALIFTILSAPVQLVLFIVMNVKLLFDKDLPIRERYMAFYRGVGVGLRLILEYIKYGFDYVANNFVSTIEEGTDKIIDDLLPEFDDLLET